MNIKYKFEAGSGMLGGTDNSQRVTKTNIQILPPGSVVEGDDWRLIHLHSGIWLYLSKDGCAHCYDRLVNHLHRLDNTARLHHLPYSV